MKKITIKNSQPTSTITHPSAKPPTLDTNAFSRVFRVRVKNCIPLENYTQVSFVLLDYPNVSNIYTMELPNGSGTALLCEGVPVPERDSFGLVVSPFGSTTTMDMFYIATYATTTPKKPKVAGETVIGTPNAGIAIDKNTSTTVVGAGSTYAELKPNQFSVGTGAGEMVFDQESFSIKNSKEVQTFKVGDSILLQTSGKIQISTSNKIEFTGAGFVFKNSENFDKKASEVLPPISFSSEEKNEFVSGAMNLGAAKYSLTLTDPSFTGSPADMTTSTAGLLKDAYSVGVLRGHSHFKIGNGDFLVSLLDNEPNPLLNRKFQVLVGKIKMAKKAELTLSSKGFTIATGAASLKLSRYLLDFNDVGVGPLSYPKWQIGYRSSFKMKIGIMAEAPTMGKSKMELIAEKILLGSIIVEGLDGGGVLTTLTDPVVDYITGIMHKGSKSVFAIG